MYESIVLLCTSNEQLKEEIRKIISFAIESKRIKILGNNFSQEGAKLIYWNIVDKGTAQRN